MGSKRNRVQRLSTAWAKMKGWLPMVKSVTVEPAAFFMMAGCLMTFVILQELTIEKICRVDLNYEDEVCNGILTSQNNSFEKEEIKIQKIAAEIKTYRSLIDYPVTILYILILGTWSDIYGRKFPMLLGITSFILQPLAMIVCVYMEGINGHWTGYLASMSRSVGGGELVFAMAAYSHISDKTEKSVRTIRTGFLSAGYTLGVPFGFCMGGVAIDLKLGYVISFGIAAGFSAISFLIVLFAVDNSKTNSLVTGDSQVIKEGGGGRCGFCKGMVFGVKDKIQAFFAVLFKKRKNLGKLKLWLLLGIHICAEAPYHGEFGVMYLFLRGRFGWDAADYGYFFTYSKVCKVTGIVISMGLFCYVLRLRDPVVGFLCGISQFGGCFMYAIATTTTLIYIAPAVDMFNGTMSVIARSMMSKTVLPDEVGKLFSLVAVLNAIIPIVFVPSYDMLYKATVETYSGYVFVLSAALTVPAQLINLWFIKRSKSKWARKSIKGESTQPDANSLGENNNTNSNLDAFCNVTFSEGV